MPRIQVKATKPGPPALDLISGYSHAQLAAHVVLQAAADLHSPDPLVSLDALLWFVDPYGAALWLDMLGIGDGEPDEYFVRLCNGKVKKQASEYRRPFDKSN